jgi:hypothetical protein
LHPDELWWLIDGKRPAKMYGSLTEDEVAELWDITLEHERQQGKG